MPASPTNESLPALQNQELSELRLAFAQGKQRIVREFHASHTEAEQLVLAYDRKNLSRDMLEVLAHSEHESVQDAVLTIAEESLADSDGQQFNVIAAATIASRSNFPDIAFEAKATMEWFHTTHPEDSHSVLDWLIS